jgi:tRNA U34 5-carboxymethylaminomethyl modifying enzyme MnmG/GidA
MRDHLAEEIAKGALGLEWWATVSAARRVAEYAARRIEKLETENDHLKALVADVIADTGDDPEIMAASRAEWAARARAAEAKLVQHKMIAGAIDKRWAESQDEVAELRAKLAKAADLEVIKAQQLFNNCALEVITYGATPSRLANLENAWGNLLDQSVLAELKAGQ